VKKTRARLAERLAALLRQDPDWEIVADEIEMMLDRSEWTVQPTPRDNPLVYARSLILENLVGLQLAEQAEKYGADPDAVDSAYDLIVNLMPSDHHLD
jgi:hypothetical protein